MKKILILVLLVAFVLPALAQKTAGLFEQLTDKYAENNGFSASQISSEMFDLYLKKRNIEEESPVYEALKGLDNILVISQSNVSGAHRIVGVYSYNSGETKPGKTEKNNKNEAKEVHTEILNHYKTSGFSLLKTEKRMGEDVKVYLQKNQNKISTLALITNSSVSTNLVELKGDIDLKTVSELNKALDLRGLENLYKIDNSNRNYWETIGYQSIPDERIEEMVLRQQELAERHKDMSKEQQIRFEEQAKIQAQKQKEMAEKYRQMAETYGRQPIFLSTPGDSNTIYYINGKKMDTKKVKEMLRKQEIEQITKTKDDKEAKTVIRIKTK